MHEPDALAAALAPTYRLERELGGGGMARVFLATETALGRDVVIKVYADDEQTAAGRQRFVREIEIAARLQHPNIVPLLSAGADDGVLWYAMPHVRGRTLRDRMSEGRIDPGLARQWLTDVARALAHAHDAGVVHRDIKPENILLSDDVAVVTDFGIAKALDSAKQSERGATLTRAGAGIGTPAYMAPEQVAGDSAVDGRADLYALGLIAWELLQGQHPFAAARTAQQLMVAQLTQVPPRLSFGRPALESLLESCMAKDPEARPRSAHEVLTVFRTTVANDMPVVVQPAVALEMPSVAVLPFANVGGDPAAEYLSDGITDEVLGTLGRLTGVRVAGRASCFAFKGQGLSTQEIAERLNVSSVVEGSVRCAGARVRVQAQLLDAATGFQKWSDRYDGDLSDVFALQDEIARRVSEALSVHITPAGTGDMPKVTVQPAAYESYLQAIHLLRGHIDPAAYARGQELVEHSLRLDSGFAPAHLAHGLVLANQSLWGIGNVAEKMSLAQRSFREALSRDAQCGEAWVWDAVCAAVLDRDWDRAERSGMRALQVAPRDPSVVTRAALYRLWRGQFRESLRLARTALALDPISSANVITCSNLLRMFGQTDEAMQYLVALAEREPMNALVWFLQAMVRHSQGAFDDALRLGQRCLELAPQSAAGASILARSLSSLGRRAEATEWARTLESWDSPSRSLASWVVAAWSELDDVEHLVHWHEEAERRREYWAAHIPFEMRDPNVRGHPRFQAMLHRIYGFDPGVPPKDGIDT